MQLFHILDESLRSYYIAISSSLITLVKILPTLSSNAKYLQNCVILLNIIIIVVVVVVLLDVKTKFL